jgi:hypothetical protein
MTRGLVIRAAVWCDCAVPDLHACAKPECGRLVAAGSLYCCAPCAESREGAEGGGYEIRGHSPGCDDRAAGHGEAVEMR